MEGQATIDELFVPVDLKSLGSYMSTVVPGYVGPITAKQFSKGLSNPKYLVTDEGSGKKYVIKRKPPGKLLIETAHQVEREYRVIHALQSHTDVPVPRVYALCEDQSVIGGTFFIMDFMQGRVFQERPLLEHLSPADRVKCLESVMDTAAKLHKADPVKIGLYGQVGFTKMGNAYERQINTWIRSEQAYLKVKGRDGSPNYTIKAHDKMLHWMRSNLPKDEIAVMHGDFGIHNMIFHPTEPRVIALIDWENCTIGHPLSDLATIIGNYTRPTALPEGFPTTTELMQRYCRSVGRPYPIPNFDVCMCWNFFKTAIQLQGIWARGQTPGLESPESARSASPEAFERTNDLALSFAQSGGAKL
ncbi:hypothetical protein HDU93_008055 [Gonapodya sp. JEL0774]|nr:hypothetical protein HDU93_008055 [Gonapodya sp. JEL0774]